MKVPLVVKIAMMMNTVIATDGPASQFHHDTPRKSFPVSASGPSVMPTVPKSMWRSPLGSASQLGPSMPIAPSTALTTPRVLKRNVKSTVIATDAVTDGK